MIEVVDTQLRAKLAAVVTDWQLRWPNEGPFETPVDGNSEAAPFIKAEVIGGSDSADIGPSSGSRHSTRSGLFRLYLCVPSGSGLTAADAKADALVTAFKRQTIYTDGLGARLTTMDLRVDDGIATREDGNYAVRMISIEWILDYLS